MVVQLAVSISMTQPSLMIKKQLLCTEVEKSWNESPSPFLTQLMDLNE